MIQMLRLNLLPAKKKNESMAARQGPLHEKKQGPPSGTLLHGFSGPHSGRTKDDIKK